ncbi:MAG: STAS domain-containing protein [Chloroflexi bacterium]|nr:STAS domain-containing protein [Chloroflexota bacterium]MBP8058263.1 STAS domain-containing protein [Chloroflexota bacterium]
MTPPAKTTPDTPFAQWRKDAGHYFYRPVEIFRGYNNTQLRPDLMAGLTVAVVMLPQAIAYALIAELPPQMGLYAAIVASVVGVLWGSSSHLHTGPTNAASLLVLSTLTAVAVSGTPEYIAAAGLLAIMVGVARLGMGLARLGVLVNFVADSVVIGFTAGAGVLIGAGQLRHWLRLPGGSADEFVSILGALLSHLAETHLPSLLIGTGVVGIIILLRRFKPTWPGPLIAMVLASLLVAFLGLDEQGVITLGELPRGLPPLVDLTQLNLRLIGPLSTGALAIALIGLVEAMSIARAIAARSGEHLDSNQEFVGQGLANIAAGLFTGYTCSGSFTRSAVNYSSGAKTPLAVIFSGLFVLLAVLLFAPFAAFLPRAALAGTIIVTAYTMVDRKEMKRVWRTSKGDSGIMVATFLATLFLPLEFAVLAGVLASFGRYIARTSTPPVHSVLPDEKFAHFVHNPAKPVCPQLAVLTIEGSLYFGACHHVEEEIRANMEIHPEQKLLLLRMHRVNLCDISGLHMLETVVRLYRQRGGDVFMVGVRHDVWEKFKASGFTRFLGVDHFPSQERAIEHIFYQVMDPGVCIYQCRVKIWKECQSLPKSYNPKGVPSGTLVPVTAKIPHVQPHALWQQMSDEGTRPRIIDVREPEEFVTGHIPNAELIPMPKIMSREFKLPRDEEVVLVCRTGRRTTQIIYALQKEGYRNLSNMDGGMVAWEGAGLPAVIE